MSLKPDLTQDVSFFPEAREPGASGTRRRKHRRKRKRSGYHEKIRYLKKNIGKILLLIAFGILLSKLVVMVIAEEPLRSGETRWQSEDVSAQ